MSDGIAVKFKKLLFGRRPNVSTKCEVGELTILLPQFDADKDPVLYLELKKKKSLHFACLVNSTCLDVKLRIRGLVKIPTERLVLYYQGAALNEDELIPEDAYDQELTENSDDDIFRARLFLHIDEVENHEEPEQSEHSCDGGESHDSFEGEDKVEKDIFEVLAENEKRAKVGGQHVPSRSFNLIQNLEKIKCQRYAPALINAGYEDEGSFSFLTDQLMREAPLFIPREARLRIMALADATRRRIFKDQEMDQTTAAAQLEEALLDGDQIKTKMVVGLDGEYTTKAEMKKAWAVKLKEEEKEFKQQYEDFMVALKREREEKHKDLPDHVYARIREVAAACERDDTACLIHAQIPTDSHWCCESHERECLRVRDGATELRALALQADLQVSVDRVDFYGTGVVFRDQLELILRQFLKKLRLDTVLSDGAIGALLDRCVLSPAEQQWQQEWTSQVARESPLTDLPLRAYSAQTFVLQATNTLLDLELMRLFNKTNDDE